MALYRYTAMSNSGDKVRGTLEAESIDAFYSKLQGEKVYCLKVSEETGAPGLRGLFGLKALPQADLAVFLRQMASMISAGITVDRAIDLIYGQCGEGRLKSALSKLYAEVQKGNQLSSAMGDRFGALVRNMVLAGESSGTLDLALRSLAEYYEKEIKLKNKVFLAMLYPIILSVVSFIVILVLFFVVLPSFITIFQSAASLPWYTKILIVVSEFFINRWYIAVIAFVIIFFGIIFLSGNERFMAAFDEKSLKIPYVGRLKTQILTARFCRVFASLYTGGIHVLEALELSGGVLGNRYIRLSLNKAAAEVQSGVALSQALKNNAVFPEMMISMLTVGEESGAVGEMLIKISDYYDEEADAAMQKLIGMLQPAIIVVLGLIISFIMISVLKPIYNMYQNIM